MGTTTRPASGTPPQLPSARSTTDISFQRTSPSPWRCSSCRLARRAAPHANGREANDFAMSMALPSSLHALVSPCPHPLAFSLLSPRLKPSGCATPRRVPKRGWARRSWRCRRRIPEKKQMYRHKLRCIKAASSSDATTALSASLRCRARTYQCGHH